MSEHPNKMTVLTTQEKAKILINAFMKNAEAKELPCQEDAFLECYLVILEEYQRFNGNLRHRMHMFAEQAYREGFCTKDTILEYFRLPKVGIDADSIEIIKKLMEGNLRLEIFKNLFLTQWIDVDILVEKMYDEQETPDA